MRKIPFLRLFVTLILGILVNAYCPGFTYAKVVVVSIALLGIVSSKICIQKWLLAIPMFGYSSILFCFVLGMISAELHTLDFDRGHFSNYIDDQAVYFEGEAVEIAGSNSYAQITLNVSSVELENTKVSADGLLKVITPIRDVKEGNHLHFLASVDSIETIKNPYAFDYSSFLARKGIYFQAFVNEITVSASHQSFLQRIRAESLRYINSLQISEDTKVLIQAMLLGDKSKLKSMSDVFRSTGTSHVLAISGLHVGIIATLLHFLLFWIPSRLTWLKCFLVVLGVWLFCLVSGMAPSTLRASIMVSSFMLGRAFNIKGMSYNFCFMSGFFMLLWNPSWIYDIGFQFSFLAIIGILFFYELIYSALVLRGLSDRIWQMVVLSISAQLTLMPLSLYYFHEFPLLFIPASVIAIPATFLMITISLLGLFLESLFGINFVLELLDWFSLSFLEFLQLLANREGMVLTNLFPSPAEIVLYYVGLVSISTFYLTRKKSYLTAFVVAYLALLGSQFHYNSIHNQNHIICYADSQDVMIDIVQSGVLMGLVEKGTKAKKLPFVRGSIRNKLGVDNAQDYEIDGRSDLEIQIGNFTLGIWNTSNASFQSDTLDILLINRKIQAVEEIPCARQIIDYGFNQHLDGDHPLRRKEALVIAI